MLDGTILLLRARSFKTKYTDALDDTSEITIYIHHILQNMTKQKFEYWKHDRTIKLI